MESASSELLKYAVKYHEVVSHLLLLGESGLGGGGGVGFLEVDLVII